eukprot:Colp12_sorted_trinity150504_noHs@22557
MSLQVDLNLPVDTSNSVRSVAKLLYSRQLQDTLSKIDELIANPRIGAVSGPVEEDPEYKVIVTANNLSVEIENEISVVHKYIRDIYSKRFPELESHVLNPLDYARIVKTIKNDMDITKSDLTFLTNAMVMMVTVSASTSRGERLTEEELQRTVEACDMMLDLDAAKNKILTFVETRMSFIAPNLSEIVGTSTAAKMMAQAGGLTSLAKIPACNMGLLGSTKRVLAGFSIATLLPHTGFVFYSPLVQQYPSDLRRKAARLASAKCALAARIDAVHEATDGSQGRAFREDIEKKLQKEMEPAPAKMAKPLPRPDDAPRKKRGGRRVNRMKEKFAQTELRRMKNRMAFGVIEEDKFQNDLGFSLGLVGKADQGRVRSAVVDSKTRVVISKRLQKELQKQQSRPKSGYGTSSTVSGLASSVAFTPVKGIEIINPNAAEKQTASHNKYFGSTANFQFKVPALPPKKQ